MTVRALACGYAVFALVAPGRLPTACPFRRLTGRRCPFCGLTGAVGAALRGQVRRSLELHPLGLPVAVGLCVAAVGQVTTATTASAGAGSAGRRRNWSGATGAGS